MNPTNKRPKRNSGQTLGFKPVPGQRLSYAQLCASILQDAQRIVAEGEERHRLELVPFIDALVKSTNALQDADAGRKAGEA